MNNYKTLLFSLLILISFFCCADEINWNDENLTWFNYSDGMKTIKKENKPGLLIFYANWCSVCKEYSKLFVNSHVTKSLKNIVLIRVDREKNIQLSKEFNFDGAYVPRTFAINSDGEIIKSLYDDNDDFIYFLPPNDPNYLVEFIALLKLKNDQKNSL